MIATAAKLLILHNRQSIDTADTANKPVIDLPKLPRQLDLLGLQLFSIVGNLRFDARLFGKKLFLRRFVQFLDFLDLGFGGGKFLAKFSALTIASSATSSKAPRADSSV